MAVENRIELGIEYFPDPNVGRPLFNANIYIGIPDLDPEIEANRITVSVIQENGVRVVLLPSSQPLLTNNGGVITYNGDPVVIVTDQPSYSIKATSQLGAQIYYVPEVKATNTVGEWKEPGIVATYVNSTTFTVPGDQTLEFHAGRRILLTGGNDRYANILSSVFTALTTISVDGITDSSGVSQNLDALIDTAFTSILSANASSAAINYYPVGPNEIPSLITDFKFPVNDLRRYGVDDPSIGFTTAIANAITCLGTQPGTLIVPGAAYTLTDARIELRYSGQNIKGLPGNSIQWAGTPPGGILSGTGGIITITPIISGELIIGNKVIDLHIFGLDEIVYTVGRQGIVFNGVDNGLIKGNIIEDFGAENILLDSNQPTNTASKGTLITKNHTIKGGNVFNSGNGQWTFVTDNVFEGAIFQGAEIASGVNIKNNIFLDIAGNITILGRTNNGVNREDAGIIFSDNQVYNCGAVEITSQTSTTPTNITVENNEIIRSKKAGIIAGAGDELDTESRVMIRGNTISECTAKGIELIGLHPGIIVTENIIYPGLTGSQTTGINGDVNNKANVYNNHVFGHSTNDINVSELNGAIVGMNFTTKGFESKSFYKTKSGISGGVESLANDSVITLFDNLQFNSAGSGLLSLNIRAGTGMNGLNAFFQFSTHIAGAPYNTISSSVGNWAGKTLVGVVTDLTGTTGAVNDITLAFYGNSTNWFCKLENRSGDTIDAGYEMIGYSE